MLLGTYALTCLVSLSVTDAAQGMNYLHSMEPPIIHRDLKSANLLCDDHFTVKVTDFGLARFNPTRDATRRTFCGTLPWVAPEVFGKGGYSLAADVYSYAVVVWEVLTRASPYSSLSAPQIVQGVVESSLRPSCASIDALIAKGGEDALVVQQVQYPYFACVSTRC